jgi:surface protein
MEIEGKETALEEYYYGNENDSKKIIEIKLIGINKVINLSYMFFDCTSLISISDISTWDTSNVKDISDMFVGCKSLTSLPDISKWNTSNVKDMRDMFIGCSSLTKLPDISKGIHLMLMI